MALAEQREKIVKLQQQQVTIQKTIVAKQSQMLWICTSCTFANSVAKAQCEMCQTPRVPISNLSAKHKKRTFKPYVPEKGYAIDECISKIINKQQLPLKIKKFDPFWYMFKDKRATGGKRRWNGEYIVEGEKVYVRIIQNVLVVKTVTGWLNFLRWCEEKLGFQE
eukprot:TRINITY_DN237_c6_g1_i1.p1 TRINITY_DN237_c6_g1~~TRINITY_DN237_c6_g1_i1.p1  ORF type:complete len:184 (-),score=48.43 TRINITY_DN237_c6_g1_i1:166-660(-)